MTTAVLIHGFSGSPKSWRSVRARLEVASYAPAVCGHGGGHPTAPTVPPGRSFEAEVDRLASLIGKTAPAPRYLAGYSLGGRLALALLVRHPRLFAGATLIGANPGIGDEGERAERREADGKWARLIEERGLDEFDLEWSRLSLFASQSRLEPGVLEEQRRIRLGHDRAVLASAMRTLSLGAMPDYRLSLSSISCPVELIVGSLDSKFIGLARKMAGVFPAATVRVVDGVGHNVPLEAPARLAGLLNAAAGRTLRGRSGDGSRCSVADRRRRGG
ncbi:MAG: alpha/beta fold hydrolase [Acidobacteria bacterium]|nr:alpha/beta fold hydrolase [Acidobacteriota bacterium]